MSKIVKNSRTDEVSQHLGQRFVAYWQTIRRHKVWRDVVWLIVVPILLYLFVSLFTYSEHDPGWTQSGSITAPVHNMGGRVGAWLADVSFQLLGRVAYFLPFMLAAVVWIALTDTEQTTEGEPVFGPALRLLGGVGFILASAGLIHVRAYHGDVATAGGIIGKALVTTLSPYLGIMGVHLLCITVFLVSITLATTFSWLATMEKIGRCVLLIPPVCRDFFAKHGVFLRNKNTSALAPISSPREPILAPSLSAVAKVEPAFSTEVPVHKPIFQNLRQEEKKPIPTVARNTSVEKPLSCSPGSVTDSALPALTLLDTPKSGPVVYDADALELLSRRIEAILRDFRIETRVTGAYPGPVIIRFEIEPAPGVKVSQISSLDKDIARGLSVKSVRVVDVIPGKSVIGLEIPNEQREIIYLSELLRSEIYEKSTSLLTLALGKDIGGVAVVADLARMPHLLVAGTTGSGKSVGVNAMVLSLLYKASHKDLRMLMIDPKMLELSVYEGIPHLLAPVVTDMKEAANALRWCVAEMERRYQLMSAVGVRNLAGFNKKVTDAQRTGQPLMDPLFKMRADGAEGPNPLDTLPFIVIIIDEFADMMMIVGKKVEELIARLAQKARAAGIHLILATQRPSVDVITGLIKANVPTRIAFQVSSKIDSRTILDQSGAETLLGYGDMLYLPPGTALPERVHGAFVSDEEVHRIVESLKSCGEAQYVDGVLDEVQSMGDGSIVGATGLPESASVSPEDSDPLYDEAVRIVIESQRASISSVQRRLKVGYNRAARLVETMESVGIVSPPEHNGERSVLVAAPPAD